MTLNGIMTADAIGVARGCNGVQVQSAPSRPRKNFFTVKCIYRGKL